MKIPCNNNSNKNNIIFFQKFQKLYLLIYSFYMHKKVVQNLFLYNISKNDRN